MSHHKIKCWWTLVPLCGLLYIVYIVIYVRVVPAVSAVCTYVHSTWRHNCRSSSSTQKGDPNGPFFYPALRGFLHRRLGQELLCVHLYIVPGDTIVAPLLRPIKGTRTVPFFIQPCGACYIDDWVKNKSASTFYLWTQGPPVNL